MLVTKEASSRSIESNASSGSSVCSDEPAMKRAVRRSGGRRPKREKVSGIVNRSRSSECKDGAKTLVANSSKRGVRFSSALFEVVAEVQCRDDMSNQEKYELYLNGADMQKIRADAKSTTKYFRMKESHSVVELDQAHTAAMNRAARNESYDVFWHFMRNADQSLEQVAAPLAKWCLKSQVTGRGLERYCSQRQRSQRTAFATECREAVLRLNKSGSISAEDVAEFYHEYARSNAIYARLMGHADEVAAKEVSLPLATKTFARTRVADIRIHNPYAVPPIPEKTTREQGKLRSDRKTLLVNQPKKVFKELLRFDTAANPVIAANQQAQSLVKATKLALRSPQIVMPTPVDRRKLLILTKQKSAMERFGKAGTQHVDTVFD